MTELEMRFKLH